MKLTLQQKRHAVQLFASFMTPHEVCAVFTEEYGGEWKPTHMQLYNATSVKGQELGAELTDYFHECREKFIAEVDKQPLYQQAYRLRELSNLYREARKRRNGVLAAALLEQASKEAGKYFTNRRELVGAGGGPVEVNYTAVTTPAEAREVLRQAGVKGV